MNARMALAAGFFWIALAAGIPLFGQNTRPAAKPAAGPAAKPAGAGPRTAAAPKPAGAVKPAASAEPLKVLAYVNSEQISRQELGQECLVRYGKDVLETLVNRQIITQACRDAGIEITDQDVNTEILRMAKRFGNMSIDRWLTMLQQERGISPQQYRDEIVWPTLALRALASDQLQVTDAELQQAFESEYGPKVRARIISVSSQEKAKEIHAKVKANPSTFSDVAKNQSEDPNSASAHGLIPPIRKHMGEPEIERVAFALKEGQISPILYAANRYHILKVERHEPAIVIGDKDLQHAEERIIERLHDEKLRKASTDLFAKLQQDAQFVNVFNDEKLKQQYPGVAARINGQSLTIARLMEECIERHGVEVLDGEINRKILTQELRRKKLQVTQEDLDEEIARAAIIYGYTKPDGTPDLAKWGKAIEQNEGATLDLYIRDAVWPSVALKKLIGDTIEITDADMQKAFQANYGERVEALAIVCTDQREAQQVWEKAKSIPSDEYFGKLAEEYSIDPISRANGGRVPPIRQHSGQPVLEKAAFALKAGDLSGLIAIDDKVIILRCLGRTRPIVTEFEVVKDELRSDLYEKKLRVAMAKEFERLRETAEVDNLLTGNTSTGRKVFGPAKQDGDVKPASGTRSVAAPRAGSLK